MNQNKQMSESLFLCSILALIGGFLDAYTYICRGKVFANAQTGNIVLLGLSVAEKNFKSAFFYFIPIVAFTLGILLSEQIKYCYKENKTNIHWRQIIILIEVGILCIIGFLPKGNLDIIANIAISFVCSLQVESFRKVNGNAFATTMCTGNLRSAAELFHKYIITKEKQFRNKSFQYFSIIILFIIGSIVGMIVTNIFAEKAVFFCCVLLAIVFLSMFTNSDHSKQ